MKKDDTRLRLPENRGRKRLEWEKGGDQSSISPPAEHCPPPPGLWRQKPSPEDGRRERSSGSQVASGGVSPCLRRAADSLHPACWMSGKGEELAPTAGFRGTGSPSIPCSHCGRNGPQHCLTCLESWEQVLAPSASQGHSCGTATRGSVQRHPAPEQELAGDVLLGAGSKNQ